MVHARKLGASYPQRALNRALQLLRSQRQLAAKPGNNDCNNVNLGRIPLKRQKARPMRSPISVAHCKGA